MSHCCNSKSHLTSNCILLYPLYVLQGAPCASYQLAVSIIQNCAEKVEPFICGVLTNCILDRDAVENDLKEFYHEVIFQIFQCAPQMQCLYNVLVSNSMKGSIHIRRGCWRAVASSFHKVIDELGRLSFLTLSLRSYFVLFLAKSG